MEYPGRCAWVSGRLSVLPCCALPILALLLDWTGLDWMGLAQVGYLSIQFAGGELIL
ncbi:hypothetical protein BO71DRAFT_395762, partial [Aspergillus ellipticus CBS 707.79]